MTDSIDPSGYIKGIRRRDGELSKGWGKIATPLAIGTEGGMSTEDKKQSEIFYNQTLAPDEITRLFELKVLTNFTRIIAKTDSNPPLPRDFISPSSCAKSQDLKKLDMNPATSFHFVQDDDESRFFNETKNPKINHRSDNILIKGNDGFKYNDAFNHSTWPLLCQTLARKSIKLTKNKYEKHQHNYLPN